MSIEITVRHTDALGDLQEEARDKTEALMAEFPRVEHIHVIMNVEKHRHIAEVIVQAKRRARIEATETSDSMRKSLHAAIEKVTTQLSKLRDRVHDHKAALKHFEQKRKRRVGEKAE